MSRIRAVEAVAELDPVDAGFERESMVRVVSRDARPPLASERPSIPHSLDEYDPDVDVVAPLSLRCAVMQLLWVCGDCGEHYVRARECPARCDACGAPREHFYAPIED